MPQGPLDAVVRHLRRLAGTAAAESTDAQLLHQFVAERDGEAFALLVRRHGGLIRTVCRHILHREEDVEDALQATLLVLAKKAASIRNGDSVASWLYGVAYRTAMNAKKTASRRRERERRAVSRAPEQPVSEAALRELQALLDEEVERLPQKYRAPFVLCCLQGMSKAEAARELGWKEGTVSGRLAQARKQLQQRLARRGVTLSAALCATGLFQDTAAAVPAAAIRGVLSFMAGNSAAISAPAAALAQGVLKAMFATKVKLGAGMLLALGALATGVGLAAHHASGARQPEDNQLQRRRAVAERTEEPRPDVAQPAPSDRYGDRLPQRAVARIGTVRWWHGHDQAGCPLVYTPNGKSLISCDSGEVILVDAATGKELRRIEAPGEQINRFALSPDGKTIVSSSRSSPGLRHWDLSTGKELRQIPTGDKDVSALAFAPDGKTFAAVTGQTVIRLWNTATWQEIRQLAGHTQWIGTVVLLPDGKTLVSGGGNARTIRWWDIRTGLETWRLETKIEHTWELAVSPDGKRLAGIVSSGGLHLWNATTGEEVVRIVLSPDRASYSSAGCMCFSPDSEILAAATSSGAISTNRLYFFSTTTGKELRYWDEDNYTTRLAFSPDGKILAQGTAGVLRLRDASTGKPVVQVPGAPDPRLPSHVLSVRFAPDGKTLLASCWGGQIGSWEPLTGEQRIPLKGPPEGFAGRTKYLLATSISGDGTKAAFVDVKGVLHVWDPAILKVWCRISEPRIGIDPADFSPDGTVLAVKHEDAIIRLWDTRSGKLRCALPPIAQGWYPHAHAFSPDGRVLATAPGPEELVVRLWDTAAGKELGQLAWQGAGGIPTSLAFTPEGKNLIAVHGQQPRFEKELSLRVWDLESGRETRQLKFPTPDVYPLGVISPDGKTFAAATKDLVLLWELASGKERGRFTGHRDRVRSLAFSPNGRLLASGSMDYTALVWDMTGLCPDGKWSARAAGPEELEPLWTDLAGEDAVRAYRAVWRMAAAARQSVPFLATRLRPVAPVQKEQLALLMADLNSDQFKIRSRASGELEKLADLAEATLRQKLQEKIPLELRQRLEQLLRKVDPAASPEKLRQVRAIEVLEHIGTTEARQVFERLAQGAPEARLTQEAKAALDRLVKRSTALP